jgi:hypothetical protein
VAPGGSPDFSEPYEVGSRALVVLGGSAP